MKKVFFLFIALSGVASAQIGGYGALSPLMLLRDSAGTIMPPAGKVWMMSGYVRSLLNLDSMVIGATASDQAGLKLYVGGAMKASGSIYTSGSLYSAGGVRMLVTGTGPRLGTATLSGGTVTVSTVAAIPEARIFISRKSTSGTAGTLTYTINAGVSFTINSSSGTDASTVDWLIVIGY